MKVACKESSFALQQSPHTSLFSRIFLLICLKVLGVENSLCRFIFFMGSRGSLKTLDAEQIVSYFCPDGRLSNSLKGFEIREQQEKMLRDVVDTYNEGSISLIEAGTGTGKSLAYLVPAVIWSLKNRRCTVISTNTINLQEQLIHKDIPLIKRVLDVDFKAVLVKGMGNYVCLRKLEDISEEFWFLSKEEQEQVQIIDGWARNTRDGSKSGLPMVPSYNVWEKVQADGDACNGSKCPHYEDCFFFRARKRAANAQLLVVNHHLLFADIATRAENNDYSKPAILPPYDHLILDEAHNIEDAATEHFAFRVSRIELMQLLTKLSSEKQGGSVGKLFLLKEKIYKVYPGEFGQEIQNLLNRIDIDLAGERRQLYQKINGSFQKIVEYLKRFAPKSEGDEDASSRGYKLRFREKHFSEKYWIEEVAPFLKDLVASLQRYAQDLVSLENKFRLLNDTNLIDKTKDSFIDITALALRLDKMATSLNEFAFGKERAEIVRWADYMTKRGVEHLTLVGAQLDMSKVLSEWLFSKFDSVVLCSATLATNQHFRFIRQRLGLTEELLGDRKIKESVHDSPFDYMKQVVVGVPTDLPQPSDSNFIHEAVEHIWKTLQTSRGNAFILFTSFSMLRECHRLLEDRLKKARYPVFKQGDDHRQILLEKFRNSDFSVLFGTDSFWEGVDVVGDTLRCVIMVKLPFQVPTEPIVQARTEAIIHNGGNAFMDYAVPAAIVKFKQGFGRLIRNRRDRGCIICLDSRLITKAYGKHFLNSLPKCKQVFEPGIGLQKKMQDFYKKTYYLTQDEDLIEKKKEWSVTESNR